MDFARHDDSQSDGSSISTDVGKHEHSSRDSWIIIRINIVAAFGIFPPINDAAVAQLELRINFVDFHDIRHIVWLLFPASFRRSNKRKRYRLHWHGAISCSLALGTFQREYIPNNLFDMLGFCFRRHILLL